MSWPRRRIGDVCDVVPGFAFRSKDLADDGVPVVKIGNITDDYAVDLTSTKCLPPDLLLEKHQKYYLAHDDIVIAMTGATAGKVGRIRCKEEQILLLNQRVATIRPKAIIADFFWSIISTPRYRTIFYSLGGGAAQPNMSGDQIESVEILMPPSETQHRIADILSAYDDLIENNRRRIQLLEESAQLLYKEWFVHLRFPGHEHTTITDGVPEGWERREVGETAPLYYGKALKKSDRVEGPFPVYGSSGIIGSHKSAIVSGPTIIVGRKGNVGSVYWCETDCHPIDTVYYVKSEHASTYMYYVLMHANFINTDAAVPGLNRNLAHSQPVLVPDALTLALFENQIKPLREQVAALNRYNHTLIQARDLLLPRLMSGELVA